MRTARRERGSDFLPNWHDLLLPHQLLQGRRRDFPNLHVSALLFYLLIVQMSLFVPYSTTDDVMFIHFIGMGEASEEIQRITHRGQEWQRLPGESEQALKDRAEQEAEPNPLGARVFLCH